jgi:hypothetical protein
MPLFFIWSTVYDRSLGREDRKEDKVAAPEVHQRGGDVNPFPTSKQQKETVWVNEGPMRLFLGP